MWRAAFICFIVHATHAQDVAQTLDSAIGDDSSTRIIGGNATTVQKYPFAVQILYNSQLSCGGTLITRQHVLSAAHCFVASNGQQVSATFFSVRVGATYTNIGGTVHQVSQVVVHHSYNNPVRDHDIAVLTLATPVTISSSVTTAYILEADVRLADSAAVVTVGWGRTNVSIAQGSDVLNEVQVFMVNQSVCETRYSLLEQLTGDPYPVTDNMICAGIIDIGGKDACQGDSGGPLLHKNIVVGITSWGWGCAQPRFPGVYTRVSAYTNWINSTASGVSHTRLGGNASKMQLNLFLMITSFFLVR